MSRAFRLGVFIVGALVILAVGIFLVGNKRFLFGSTYKVTADFDDVSGLVDGADVRVAGIHAGTVSAINLPQQPGGKVTVEMHMEKKTRGILHKDSTAMIQTEGLLGNKYIELSYGSPNGAAIAGGDIIQGVNPPSLEAEANQATAEAGKTLSQIGSAVSTFQDDAEALKHNFLLRGFFKKRGYYDEKNLTEYRIAQLPSERPQKEFTFDLNRIFPKPDSDHIKDHKDLDRAGKFLQQKPFAVAVVSANPEINQTADQKLEAEALAKTVRDYLTQQFKLAGGKVRTYGGADVRGSSPGKLRIFVYAPSNGSANQEANASGN